MSSPRCATKPPSNRAVGSAYGSAADVAGSGATRSKSRPTSGTTATTGASASVGKKRLSLGMPSAVPTSASSTGARSTDGGTGGAGGSVSRSGVARRKGTKARREESSDRDRVDRVDAGRVDRADRDRAERDLAAVVATYQRAVTDHLTGLTAVLLRASGMRTFHDPASLEGQVGARAAVQVQEELAAVVAKLTQLQGSSAHHPTAAMCYLLSRLVAEVHDAVFTGERQAIATIKNQQCATLQQAEVLRADLTRRLARNEQTILVLQAERAHTEFKNKSLVRTVELLSTELESCSSNLTDQQQRGVLMQIQGLDYKGEVDRACGKIVQSVTARLGFVPASILQQVTQLKALKPPGDANFDKLLEHTRRRSSSSSDGLSPRPPRSERRRSVSSDGYGANYGRSPPPVRPSDSAGAGPAFLDEDRNSTFASAVSETALRESESVASARTTTSTTAVVPLDEFDTLFRSPSTPLDLQRRQALLKSLFPDGLSLEKTTSIAGISMDEAGEEKADQGPQNEGVEEEEDGPSGSGDGNGDGEVEEDEDGSSERKNRTLWIGF